MSNRVALILTICLFTAGHLCGQSPKQYDSLLQLPYTYKYNAITTYIGRQPDSAAQFRVADELLERARQRDKEQDILCLQVNVWMLTRNWRVDIDHFFERGAALLREAERAGNRAAIGDLYCGLAAEYFDRGNYKKVFENYLRGYSYFTNGRREEFFGMAYLQYSLALAYYQFLDYENALKYSRELASEEIKTTRWVTTLNYDLLGMTFLKQQQYDSAIVYFKKTCDAAGKYQDPVGAIAWRGIGYGNIGLALYKQQKYSEAIPYLQKGAALCRESNVQDNLASFSVCLANIYLDQNGLAMAEQYLQTARDATYKAKSLQNYNELYPALSELYRKKGDAARALQYQDSALLFKDSVAAVLNVTQKNSTEIAVADEHRVMMDKLAENDRQKQIWTRNSLIALCLMALLAVLLLYNRKLLKQKMKQEHLQTGKQLAEAELVSAQKLLDSYKTNIIEKNELILSLEKEISTGHDSASLAVLQQSTILTDEQWESFRQLFEKVHPGFLGRLRDKMPGLTPAETRLMVLAKLSFTNKEMAAALGVTGQAIRTTWYRLRKKLNLPEEGSLEELVERI